MDFKKKKKKKIKQATHFVTKKKKTRFGYKLVRCQFTTTHYVAAYKTIDIYYLKKSYDSLNRSCD